MLQKSTVPSKKLLGCEPNEKNISTTANIKEVPNILSQGQIDSILTELNKSPTSSA